MTRMYSIILTLFCTCFCCVSIISFSGCSNEYNLQKIIGEVTIDGQPGKGVAVTFVAQEPEGRDCGGYTDDSGIFTLNTTVGKSGSGTSPGKYKVCFQRVISVKELPDGDPRKTRKAIQNDDSVNVLPERYALVGETEFEVDVVQGKNRFTFDLTGE